MPSVAVFGSRLIGLLVRETGVSPVTDAGNVHQVGTLLEEFREANWGELDEAFGGLLGGELGKK